jgi:hypothetical protein
VLAHSSTACPNCGTPTPDLYCPRCGQRNADLQLSLRELAGEAAEEALGLDSRVAHTARPFLLQPGALTRDYLAGKRARYTSPLKLYLVASAVYFLALAFRGDAMPVSFGASQNAPHVGVNLPTPSQVGEVREKLQSSRIGAVVWRGLDKLLSAPPAEQRVMLARYEAEFPSSLAKAMFLLVPLFAGLLQLFFRGRYYVENLVFALHLHAFWFVLHTPPALAGLEWLSAIATLGGFVYVFMAFRTVYGQSRLRIGLKLFGILSCYGILLAATLSAVALAGLLML